MKIIRVLSACLQRSRSNNVQDYIDSKGWMHFTFGNEIDPYDQSAIDAEVEYRKHRNQEYIAQLHKEGIYGEEYQIEVHIQHNPALDAPGINPILPVNSYRMIFLNCTDDESQNLHSQYTQGSTD